MRIWIWDALNVDDQLIQRKLPNFAIRHPQARKSGLKAYASQPARFSTFTKCAASGRLVDFMFRPSHSMRLPSPTRS